MVHATMAAYDRKNEASAGGYQQRMHKGVGNARIQQRERKNQQHFNLVFTTPSKKPHLRWTPRLHDRFEKAVAELGGPFKATPKLVLDKMGVDGLTLLHVKSHLQKYRHGKLPESNRLMMADLNIRGISMSPIEESPFAGSSSNVPIFTAFRAAFAAQMTQHATSTRTGMQTCTHMTQVQQKQTALSTYLKSLGQRTYISCGDQATALLEMVDLLSSPHTPIFGLESHSGINLERGSFTPEPVIDTKALPYCSSPGMDGRDHEDMMDYLLSQSTASMPTSNEESLSCLQPRAVNGQATENITTFLSDEPQAPTFQPRILDDWEIEDAGTPPALGIMNQTQCFGDQGAFENEDEGIDAVYLSWLN